MSHAMKLWERMLEQNLRKKSKDNDNQFDFISWRSTWKRFTYCGI